MFEHPVGRHTTNFLYLRTPDRLSIGDDGQRLQGRRRKLAGTVSDTCFRERFGMLAARQQLVSLRQLHEFKRVFVGLVVLSQRLECLADIGRRYVGLESPQLAECERVAGREQRCFKQLR